MQRTYASAFAVAIATGTCSISAGSGPAFAGMPAVQISADNPMPSCATPGRLQAFLKTRNPSLEARYETIAADYMRHGEALGMRWDYGFFQMIAETGQLSFRNGSRAGDVKPQQNNFAGLGATGNGEAGESFPDISAGVRAHLEHVLIYAGQKVEQPVAERTRKVQQWGVLNSWQKAITHPITFTELATKWKSKSYADQLEQIANTFYDGECKKPDPNPEMVAMVSGQSQPTAVVTAAVEAAAAKGSGADLAKRAQTETGERSALGAAPKVKILNAPATDTPEESRAPQPAPGVAGHATAGSQKCRVWTASYGGQRAVIVKAMIDKVANYTVLDVNEGQETREAEAFIAAYAKGGVVAETFPNQDRALAKAFEMCPEG